MYSRCEGRVSRDNKRVLNGFRMETLQQMMRICIGGMTREQSRSMRDNLVAMSDLSDDEGSPTHGKTEDVVKDEIPQAFQAYQVGQHLVDQMNVEIANEEELNVGEGMGSDSDSSDPENLPEQLRRYFAHTT